MTYQCPRCSTRVKDWNGSDPICGFNEDGTFKERNWNCATLNALRELLYDETDYRVSVSSGNDHSVGVIHDSDAGSAILTWYKHRGRTDKFMDLDGTPLKLIDAQYFLRDRDPLEEWEHCTLLDDENND